MFDKITGGDLANEIAENYNVTLDVGSTGSYQQLLHTYDIRCTNYVRISPETLLKMEQNPELKDKVLNEIEAFCSEKQQAEIRALYPPVKSSGMMIYPDGSSIPWVEGYPNGLGDQKNNKQIVSNYSSNNLFQKYQYPNYNITGNNLNTIMQIMAAGYRKW